MELPALEPVEIEGKVKNAILNEEFSISIMLTSGNFLFGNLNGGYVPFFNESDLKDFFVHENKEDYFVVETDNEFKAYEIKFNPIEITNLGALGICTLKVDNELIADVRTIEWDRNNETIKDSIRENNNDVAAKLGIEKHFNVFAFWGLGEFSDQENGVKFNQNELIYVDWDFISHISGGTSVSLNVSPLSVKPGRTPNELVMDKIKNGFIEKVTKTVFRDDSLKEKRVSGFLNMPEEEIETTIEGEKWIVGLCSDEKSLSSSKDFLVLLIKDNSIAYPNDLFPHISSELVFYGDLMEMPLVGLPFGELKISADYVLKARVIGHLSN